MKQAEKEENLLDSPQEYQDFINRYGIQGENYRHLYLSIMAFRPGKGEKTNFSFVQEQLLLLHQEFHQFLGDSSFLSPSFEIQLVPIKTNEFLVNVNQFIDFSEIQERIDKAYQGSVLFSSTRFRQIEIELTACELVGKDFYHYFSSTTTIEFAERYRDIFLRNCRHALLFSMFGVINNFFYPLMELYRKGYYYLGYGLSKNERICYYIGRMI